MSVFDVFLALGWILLHKVLVNGQGHQLDAIAKSVPLQVAQVRAMVLSERLFFGNVHLAMENIHTFHAELSSLINDSFDGDFRVAEMPVGIGADPELDALFGIGGSGGGLFGFCSEGQGSAYGCAGGEERASIHHTSI